MNKFIKSDLRDAQIQLKCAIMNALYDLDHEESKISLEGYIPITLVEDCLNELGWAIENKEAETMYVYSPSKKPFFVDMYKKNIIEFFIDNN